MSTVTVLEYKGATGLGKKVAEISTEANRLRRQGQVISFRDACRRFMRQKSLEGIKPSERDLKYGPEVILNEWGIEPSLTTYRELITFPDVKGYSWIVPEVILDAVQQGILNDDWYKLFVSSSSPTSGKGDVVPLFPRHTKKKVKGTTEAADPFRSSVKFAEKTVETKEFAHAFDISYKALQRMTLNALALHFRLAADNLAVIRRVYLLTTLVTGEQADNSENIVTIGVEDKTKGFQYVDLLRGWVRMGNLGRMPDAILLTEANALKLLEMDEFKNRAQGTTDKTLRLRQPLPTDQNVFIDSSVTDDYILLVDSSASIAELRGQAPLVESERIIQKRIVDTVYSEEFGLYTLVPTSRLRFDLNANYTASPFPASFAANVYN